MFLDNMAYMKLKTKFVCFNYITLLATELYLCIICQYSNSWLVGQCKSSQAANVKMTLGPSYTTPVTALADNWNLRGQLPSSACESLHSSSSFSQAQYPISVLVCDSKGHAVRLTRSLIEQDKLNSSHTVLWFVSKDAHHCSLPLLSSSVPKCWEKWGNCCWTCTRWESAVHNSNFSPTQALTKKFY